MLKRRLNEPFGKAGLTVAVLALVVAMAGGAYAAGGLTKTQEKQVTKIAKKYAGKPGAAGPTGPAGTAGAAGKNGTDGTNGGPGTNGKSVAIGTTAPGCGARGGHTIEVAGEAATKQNVCNGEEGKPWTELGVLPEGQAETGAWGFTRLPVAPGFGGLQVPISFPIPLASPLSETAAHIVGISQTGPPECEGGTSEAPAAAPGNLCVYITFGENSAHLSGELEPADLTLASPETVAPGTGKVGVMLSGSSLPEGAYGFGSWVLRAPGP